MNDLFIGGGGYSGLIFIGALEFIHEKKLLDLKNFYGCSIGSLIGCLYISGFTPKNMVSKFLDINLDEIVKYDFNNLPSENFIIDDILLEASFLDDYLKTFCDLKLYFIGLFCPLEAVEKREASRIGRFPGTAQSQLEVCHAHGVYDLSLDTSILSPEDCAEKIIDRLASGAPEAFKTLRA